VVPDLRCTGMRRRRRVVGGRPGQLHALRHYDRAAARPGSSFARVWPASPPRRTVRSSTHRPCGGDVAVPCSTPHGGRCSTSSSPHGESAALPPSAPVGRAGPPNRRG
jgi:hypothetical protein